MARANILDSLCRHGFAHALDFADDTINVIFLSLSQALFPTSRTPGTGPETGYILFAKNRQDTLGSLHANMINDTRELAARDLRGM